MSRYDVLHLRDIYLAMNAFACQMRPTSYEGNEERDLHHEEIQAGRQIIRNG